MADEMLRTAARVRQLANELAKTAEALRDRRKKDFLQGTIDANEAAQSISEETTLNEQVTKLFIRSNDFVISAIADPQKDLINAIAEANVKIATIAKFKKSLKVVAGVISLAAAVMSGQPAAVLGAIQGVKDATA